MDPKQVTAYQATDQSLHLTRLGALICTAAHEVSQDALTVETMLQTRKSARAILERLSQPEFSPYLIALAKELANPQ